MRKEARQKLFGTRPLGGIVYGIVVCPKCMQIQGIKIEGRVSYGCNGCRQRHKISKIKIWNRVNSPEEVAEAVALVKEKKWGKEKND
ncbi:MAG: hypothetical protein BEU04_00850 [Marine Group III euryarchaeote CG-Bathy1]|uniref:DUF1922 domain-containing protein n=1 Tax=Marine Group III euryarchaeote CG-Bathy1 TaxID=1889001 RepID=A0A1J5U2W2_9ARCH|nr:MAG: hypothetical protein BEU04_00850 [Marine Group III euryarchaeote CG-Bathy1]